MSSTVGTAKEPIVYPDSDGQPMADNTLQFRWIVTIQGGLDALLAKDPNVFVAGDLLWYPVEGDPTIRQAPDVMVAFGRPNGYRGSYRQWEEGGVAPQVVFEVLSPGNRPKEMVRKFQFYERYGVEEYYIYDPDQGELAGWLRESAGLMEIPNIQGWVSPRLKVRFTMVEGELQIYRPDGLPLATYVELVAQRDQAQQAAVQAQQAAVQAQQAAAQAQQAAVRVEQVAAQLRAQLKALGVEPEA
jgi:Uma2 family endonuclease